jgi:hypothetical protein
MYVVYKSRISSSSGMLQWHASRTITCLVLCVELHCPLSSRPVPCCARLCLFARLLAVHSELYVLCPAVPCPAAPCCVVLRTRLPACLPACLCPPPHHHTHHHPQAGSWTSR